MRVDRSSEADWDITTLYVVAGRLIRDLNRLNVAAGPRSPDEG